MEEKRIIYLDNSATTKISEVALKKYNEVSLNTFGNPSSLHTLGFNAEKILDEARGAIRASLASRDAEIIFTASGSEANNLAITGRAHAKERYGRGSKIITTEGEHASVSEPLQRLEKEGFDVVRIATKGGIVDLEALKKELSPSVILLTIMMVNNETGALYDIKSISELMRSMAPNAILHVDATQSYMKIPFTLKGLGIDMLTVSSHKIEGPKGVGALIVDPRIKKEKGLSPIIFGGGQEGGMRSGTENVPGIAAFGTAATEGKKLLSKNFAHMSALRERLISRLSDESFSEISITDPPSHAPHILNITLPSIKSETMLHFLSSEGICVSSGSACSSNSAHRVSSALVAYGRSEDEADSSIRISFAPYNTDSDVEDFCDTLALGLKKLARKR